MSTPKHALGNSRMDVLTPGGITGGSIRGNITVGSIRGHNRGRQSAQQEAMGGGIRGQHRGGQGREK